MSQLFLDRDKTHIIKDKDRTLEIMFDGGMKMWYVKIKYDKIKITYSGSYYSRYAQNEIELCEAFPIVKDYMKKEQFNNEMKDIINEESNDTN